jgi:UDP-N-acetylmuramyl pentapeptide phosphotransferase/UDP-N-acetylglucosamine-1-phosphate transferase
VWFVNLTNFMDGIDGITVAGIVPVVAGIALFAANAGPTASMELVIALALIGALLGFAPSNVHVASVFLGDVGSLAIGGIVAFLLLSLACRGQLIAALILPLYYLADTAVTLLLRWRRGAVLGEAHREHFYQRAVGRGLGVPRVTAMVWALNGVLLLLALLASASARLWLQLACLALAIMLTTAVLRYFAGDRART